MQDGLELCYALALRERVGVDLIACPTCGRIQVDLFTLVPPDPIGELGSGYDKIAADQVLTVGKSPTSLDPQTSR